MDAAIKNLTGASKYRKIIHTMIMNHKTSPEQLKEVMRTWTTGVAIVTGYHHGVVHGMTVNSFNSIALEPPTVLVGVQHHSRTQQLIKDGGFFGVTVLSYEQVALARRFAGQIDQDRPRFEDITTFSLVSDVPLISDGLAFLDCQVVHEFDVGLSTVFIGEVIASQIGNVQDEPLLYLNRQWRRLAE